MNKYPTWNDRYLNQDTPWDIGAPHPEMQRLFLSYIPKNQSVLEIGCGYGTNAFCLEKMGYNVTAIDVSAEAIKKAQRVKSSVDFKEMDFLQAGSRLGKFSVIFDCAVFHTFSEQQLRQQFIAAIADCCVDRGYWINISCSNDDAENIEKQTEIDAPPSLTANEIIEAVEPVFEIIEMKHCEFTIDRKEQGKATFNAWGSVFRKRK